MAAPAPANALVLAFDIGTSSLRTALFDAQGRRLDGTTARQTYPLDTDTTGKAELEARRLLAAATSCLEETLSVYRKKSSLKKRPIIAVGTSCFWHSLIGLDREGRALTPVYTWADSRCQADAERLRASEGAEKSAHRRTGAMLRASFWTPKLVWLRRTRPRLFRQVRRWVSPAEWLDRQFADDVACSYSMASGTGLLAYRTLRWDAALLKNAGITRDQLPRLSDAPGALKKDLAERYPELAAAAWVPAIGDGAASNLGSGATKSGWAAINVGTSAAIRVVVDTQSSPRQNAAFGLFAYRINERLGLMGGAVSNAGNLRQWCLRELNLPDKPARIEKALARRPWPEHGLRVLPFWVGERAPSWNEHLRGAVLGISSATTALDLLQATTEAVYLRLASIARLLESSQRRRLRYLVSGGIQQSPGSMQRLADVLGAPVEAADEAEASLRGGALFALQTLGLKPPSPPPLAKGNVFRPRAQAVRAYAKALTEQEKLERELNRIGLG